MPSGLFIQNLNARTIAAHGIEIAVGDATLYALSRSFSPKDSQYLPEGTDNAAFGDLSVYTLIPSEMAQKNLPMSAGTVFLDMGLAFTVLTKPLPIRADGIPVEQIVVAYRTPPADASVAQATGSQDSIWAGREANP